MDFTFIHAADIHLDSPLRGLEQYEGAPVEQIRNATREAFINLVDAAIENKVAFVIIAGDLYDGDWKDYNTGLFFISQMTRLQKEGIPVILIRGNHDAASQISKELKLPENVKELSVNEPETILLEEFNTAIHGQGFSSRSVMDNLVLQYPIRKDGYLNIGIVHTSATGREGHEHYAPCSLDDLKAKSYDYWALGHIHLREVLSENEPVVLFPGNIQGRHIKETGDKGCTFVHVRDSEIQSIEHHTLDVVRWQVCEVDANGVENTSDLVEKARELLEETFERAEGRFLAVRFRIYGACSIHQELLTQREHFINNIRSLSLEVGQGDIWIEKVKIQTAKTVNIDELRERNTPLASILDYLQLIKVDDEAIASLLAEFKDLHNALPHELKQTERGLDFNNPMLVKERFEEVEDLILHYLTKQEVGAV
ncbi:DNA repair exonuclease [Peribacillus cavernae]|uniref:DNA repair exonuclease n=1 Tax=Peribacillus cavernae TaxID=1674310 RepID=A0A3S0VLE7_9BACI|nr:DNA repair exonuclease [Peribacillus cavernae]MDQ0217664.1 DNA repair exonuclease SbcCD nuclease subunit [Peribacillus cavernae]RUQ28139.1 DNA repair exonuclease [Peribacillus cavernae]